MELVTSIGLSQLFPHKETQKAGNTISSAVNGLDSQVSHAYRSNEFLDGDPKK